MKKFIIFFITCILTCFMLSCASIKTAKKQWYKDNPKVEVINETTVIFKDVVKIEIKSCKNCSDQITYIYDLYHSKIMKVARGSFEIELPRGNYLIQSNKKITRVDYEVIIE